MLSKKDNLLECIKGGSPDRYVNQYEAFQPMVFSNPLSTQELDENGCLVDEWGVTWKVAGQPGRMPLHDMDHRVVKDIADWKSYVHAPTSQLTDPGIWEPIIAQAEAIDTSEVFLTAAVFPGVFERLHHLCELTEALMALYEEPQAIKDLLKVITEHELVYAEQLCAQVKPEVIFHHDDWGTQNSTFMSDDMFEEFLLEPYKQIYGYYKNHGVKLIIHHSDTYGMTLVPHMIEVGVDIWQGALSNTNDIQQLVDQYGDKLTVMGGIEDQEVDKEDWTPEDVEHNVNHVLDTIDRKKQFIPCITHGLYMSLYDGVYDAISAAIDKRSKIDFD